MKFIVYNIDILDKLKDIIIYDLNNREKTNKMELYDFINDYNL